MVKVLQTSKNLLQKNGNTAVMEKAGARSLEDLSSIHNNLWELRHVVKALWALCFNLENGSKKSDQDRREGSSRHMCECSPPFQGAGKQLDTKGDPGLQALQS